MSTEAGAGVGTVGGMAVVGAVRTIGAVWSPNGVRIGGPAGGICCTTKGAGDGAGAIAVGTGSAMTGMYAGTSV